MGYKLITDYPLAENSPDHLYPKGTRNTAGGPTYNWVGGYNPFADEVINFFKEKGINRPRVLDLGAASGHLVADFLERGADAVGLEGSDWGYKNGKGNWKKHFNKRLFTCDISKPFKIVDELGKQVQFDFINAWEVCEHLPPDELSTFSENVFNHLTAEGIFTISVSPWFEPHDNALPYDQQINLHLSKDITKKKEWEEIFNRFTFTGPVTEKHDSSYHYLFKNRYRGRIRGPEGEKHTFWSTLQKSL